MKGVSYFLVSSPSLMDLSEAGPQQKTSEKEKASDIRCNIQTES